MRDAHPGLALSRQASPSLRSKARALVGARDACRRRLGRVVAEHLARATSGELLTRTRAIGLAGGRRLVGTGTLTGFLLAEHLGCAALGELDVVGLLGAFCTGITMAV